MQFSTWFAADLEIRFVHRITTDAARTQFVEKASAHFLLIFFVVEKVQFDLGARPAREEQKQNRSLPRSTPEVLRRMPFECIMNAAIFQRRAACY